MYIKIKYLTTVQGRRSSEDSSENMRGPHLDLERGTNQSLKIWRPRSKDKLQYNGGIIIYLITHVLGVLYIDSQ